MVDVLVTERSGVGKDPSGQGLSDNILESVAISGVTSIAGQPAMLSNLAFSNTLSNVNLSQENSVANQQALNEVGICVTGKQVQLLSSLDPLQSKSALEILTGNAMAEMISALKAATTAFKEKKLRLQKMKKMQELQELPGKTPDDPLTGKRYYAEPPMTLIYPKTNIETNIAPGDNSPNAIKIT